MLIAWNCLEQLVDLSGFTPKDVAEILTRRGLEVEGIVGEKPIIEGIIVARLEKISEHPDSDHLHIVQVDIGEKKSTVVCGAPGIQEGWLVPYAPVGSKIGDLTIEARKVRGQFSEGMLCSEAELRIGNDHSGLLKLSDRAKPGMSLQTALELDARPTVPTYPGPCLEISLTPDRGDCLSHKGIARELASGLRRVTKSLQTRSWNPDLKARLVNIQNTDDCPRYLAVTIEGIKVGPSPAWLRRAVEALGARSVNNVVDVTNYVCFELGQPMHAFDLEKLSSAQIHVRRANNGEKLLAINHNTYDLSESDLVIADDEKALAIAGVMGGADSEVSEKTQKILLEIAAFSPSLVRKTAKRLALHSESSHRFERGIDAASIIGVAKRAIYLLEISQNESLNINSFHDSAEGEIDSKYALAQDIWHPDGDLANHCSKPLPSGLRLKPMPLKLKLSRVNDILGTKLIASDIINILTRVGFIVKDSGQNELEIIVPTHRVDVNREIDVIEEIARDLGFDRIEAALPNVSMQCQHKELASPRNKTPYPLQPTIWSNAARSRQHLLRNSLIKSGLMECMHYSFMDPADPEKLGFSPTDPESNFMRIANPMAIEQSCMRTTLIPSMLRALKNNISQQQELAAFFELGSVFMPKKHGDILCLDEEERLCFLLWGKRPSQWSSEGKAFDVFDLKGIIEALAKIMHWPLIFSNKPEKAPYLHDGVQAAICYEGNVLGHLGELHPRIARAQKIEGPAFIAEFKITALNALVENIERCRPLPRFPRATRDLSLLVQENTSYAEIAKVIEENRPSILEYWQLFDVYRGKQIQEGSQSVSLSFVYRHPRADDPEIGRTLTDDEINAAQASLLKALEEKLKAQIRV